MPVNAKTAAQGEGGDFVRQTPMDEGTYPARVVQAIFYGMQPQNPYGGKDKEPRDEVGYTYEFLDEFCLDDEGEEDESLPRWVSESFPVFNLSADKAKSTKRITALDPDDDLDGDFLKVVGTPCVVTISLVADKKNKGTLEEPKDGDKWYNNVTNVSPMRPKDVKKAPELVNPMVVFDVEEPNEAVFKEFPEWTQKKLKSHLGYEASPLQEMVENMDDNEGDDAPAKDDKPAKKKKKKKHKKDKNQQW